MSSTRSITVSAMLLLALMVGEATAQRGSFLNVGRIPGGGDARKGGVGGDIGGGGAADTEPRFANSNKLIVRMDGKAAAANMKDPNRLNSLGLGSLTLSASVDVVNMVVLEVGQPDNIEATRAALEARPDVLYAERDYEMQALATPDDPMFDRLYGMRKIDAPQAWNTTTGNRDVVVCVIDTGVDYNHADLAANMWINGGEIPGNNIDDDNNGYVDDVYGIDTVNNDSDPMDDHSHGTHCAGTIGAVGNNTQGVIGVSPNVSIMACKFLSASGSGSTSGAIACLQYALDNGAHITSNSWGGGPYSQALKDVIDEAEVVGQLFVAAAGNRALDNDETPHYPSSYSNSIVLSVASTDETDRRSSFSQWGLTSVDMGAPGSNILSTTPGGNYGMMSGTSMATPHVAGAAALLLSLDPTLTGLQIKAALMSSSEIVPDLQGRTVSGGRLNVARAIQLLEDGFLPEPPSPAPTVAPEPPGPSAAPTEVLPASQFDLASTAVTYTPSSDRTAYATCSTPIESLPEDTSGSTTLSQGDDSFQEINFTSFRFPLYNSTYSTAFVGSNGYITFGSGDTFYLPTTAWHFNRPRISAMFTDLNPSGAGTISWKELPGKVVITYSAVPRFGCSSCQNTFQMVLREDGSFTLAYTTVSQTGNKISGVSSGSVPRDFVETDLSTSSECSSGTPTPTPAGPTTPIATTTPTPAPSHPPAPTEAIPEDRFDLASTAITYTPSFDRAAYATCSTPIESLPEDTSGSTPLSHTDDSSQEITFNSFRFPLYDSTYSSAFVGSNGYITFGSGDSSYDPALNLHFNLPRISAMFTDLNPTKDGTISWKELPGKVVITYSAIPRYGCSSCQNTFQMVLREDGSFTVAYTTVSQTGNKIVGVSSGSVPQDFEETDLSASGRCPRTGPLPTPAPTTTATPTPTSTPAPTSTPTPSPTTQAPTAEPTPAPTSATSTPTPTPTPAPTAAPTPAPTTSTPTPTPTPTPAPTAAPTPAPTTSAPTPAPTPAPTSSAPTPALTPAPTTSAPTPAPTPAPTEQPLTILCPAPGFLTVEHLPNATLLTCVGGDA